MPDSPEKIETGMPASDRMAKMRARRKARGEKEVGVFLTPENAITAERLCAKWDCTLNDLINELVRAQGQRTA